MHLGKRIFKILIQFSEEMKNFARQWVDPSLKLSSLLFVTVFHIALIAGVILGLATLSWVAGLIVASCVFFLIFTFLMILWCFGKRYVYLYVLYHASSFGNFQKPQFLECIIN